LLDDKGIWSLLLAQVLVVECRQNGGSRQKRVFGSGRIRKSSKALLSEDYKKLTSGNMVHKVVMR